MKHSKPLVYVIMLICILCSTGYSQQSDNWMWLNPKPQGNSLYAMDFADNATGYSVGAFGSIIKTTNSGDNWNKIASISNDPLFSVDFINSQLGFMGGTHQTLKKTTDGAQSWNSIQLPVEEPIDSLFDILDIKFLNLDLGYVLGFFLLESKIWKTTDGGASWTSQATAGANYLNTLYFLDENNGYAVGGSLGSEIIKTTNGGTNWELVEYYNFPALSDIHFFNPTTGLAAGENGCVLMTTNEGVNWTQTGSPSNLDVTSLLFLNNNSVLGIGEGNVYIKTTNGGLNWTETDLGLGYIRIYNDAQLNSDGIIHAIGSFGVIIRSTNSGDNWESQYTVTEKTLSEIRFVNNTTGYAVCGYSDGDILKSTDAGETWVSQTSTFITPMYGLSFTDAQTGYIAGALHIKKTTNGGENWINVYTSTSNEIFTDITFTNSNTGYSVGSYGKLLKTTNGGVGWTPSTISSMGSILTSVCFVNENTGYSVGDNGVIIKTTNAGLNWTDQSSPFQFAYITSIDFTDENTGYISCGQGILRTTNGGEEWIITSAPSGGYYKVQFRNSFGYSVASNGKIIKSIDSGINWIEQPTVTNNGLYALYFNFDNHVYAGGSVGTIIKTTPTELLATNTILNLTMFIEGLYNPITNSMVSDSVKVYLRNSSAPYSLVDSALSGLSSEGNAVFNLSNVSSGQYYIIAKQRNSIETWSREGGESITTGSSINYNMSDQISKAYGNNLKQVDAAPVRFANYSGDVNKDGNVNLTDILSVNNNATNFVTGYNVTDMNGDNFTGLTDVIITFNNLVNFVSIKRP